MFGGIIRKCNAGEFRALGGVTNTDFRSHAEYFIAEHNGKLVGKLGFVENFLDGRGPHLFAGTFKVEIENMGVGSSLILAFEEYAKEKGIPLVIHRFSDNGGFYEKKGYSVGYEYNEAHKGLNW